MVKKYLLTSLIIISFLGSFAQHCPWDGSSLLMLDVKSDRNHEIQKIYLLASAGTIVINTYYFGHDSLRKDTAVFWKNPGEKNANINYNYEMQRFPFARDYYIRPFSWGSHPRPYSIVIYLASGKEIFQKRIPVTDKDVHVLCTSNKELWGGKVKAMEVSLE